MGRNYQLSKGRAEPFLKDNHETVEKDLSSKYFFHEPLFQKCQYLFLKKVGICSEYFELLKSGLQVKYKITIIGSKFNIEVFKENI